MRKRWEEMPVPIKLHHQGHAPVLRSDGNLAGIFSVLSDCTRVCVFTSVLSVTNSSEGFPDRHRVSVILLPSNNEVL